MRHTERRSDGLYVSIRPFLSERQRQTAQGIEETLLEVEAIALVKEFKNGQRVKVSRGRYANHVGQVLETNREQETATILTENQNQITVRANDLVLSFSDQPMQQLTG